MIFFELVIIIAIIILFVKVRNTRRYFNSRIENLEAALTRFKAPPAPEETEEVLIPEEIIPDGEPEVVKATVTRPPELKPEPVATPPMPSQEEHRAEQERPSSIPAETEKRKKKESDWAVRWKKFKQNVDWEQFTGKKLSAWLGGLSLFIAAGFFVKFSIDRNLIPMELRLASGALLGIILIIVSSRFKKESYTVMRHTLVSCGIGVLYAVVYAAIHYGYLSRPLGFGLLSLVSAASFVLAVFHKGVSISVLGALGAYATPVLVSTGSGNIIMLFVYLSVVNIGLYRVARYLLSQTLLLVAGVGTVIILALGIYDNFDRFAGYTMSGIWVANLALFSLFLGWSGADPDKKQSTRLTGIFLYLTTLVMALALLIKPDASALLTVTAAISGAVALAYRNEGWFPRVIPYAGMTFIVALLWAGIRFSPRYYAISFILLLLYGVAGGLGPVVLIQKYGLSKSALRWFKVFPVAVMAISLIGLFKNPQISFWFWPLILGLQLLGIGISLLISAFLQVALLILLFIAAGLFWIFNAPLPIIGFGFFGFVLFSGILMCVAIFLLMRKLPGLIKSLPMDKIPGKPLSLTGRFVDLEQWMPAAPTVGAFALLGAAFAVYHPFFPHPGMATLVCFLGLALFFTKRIGFHPPGIIALLAAAAAQAVWVFNSAHPTHVLFAAVMWSAGLFLAALVLPFIAFRNHQKWKKLINAWAIFEVLQSIFLFHAVPAFWDNPIAKWIPLLLALLKFPAVAVFLRRLSGSAQRNSILAFHGGAMLFYISTLPVLVLDHGWIGLTFVFEATALLWLNRRIEHPGLRWVATFLAPVGMVIIALHVPALKGAQGIAVMNSAVLAVFAAIIALGVAVKFCAYPEPRLGRIHLPGYFLGLALSAGFYFINLIISDLLAAPTTGLKVIPGIDLSQLGMNLEIFRSRTAAKAIATAAGWLIYGLGLLVWPRKLGRWFRIAGVALIFMGIIKTLLFPFIFKTAFGAMTPLVNMPSLLFLFLIVSLTVLTLRSWKQSWPFPQFPPQPVWGFVLAVVAFILLNIEIASFFGMQGKPFTMLTHGNLAMQLAYSIGWMLFSIALMVAGIRWNTVKVRWAAIILLVGTALKIFILDLWKLGQLYRVGSFVGLAVVLILVSFLYQRFLSEGKSGK